MKSLVFIVLLVLAGIAGYNFINKPIENVETVVVVDEVKVKVANNEVATADETSVEGTVTEETGDTNMITPTDMSEEAQHKMYSAMMAYNKCMMLNRPEYHQPNIRAEDIAGQTLAACEPNLDALRVVLEANNVNSGLTDGMLKTVRQKSTRKLMSTVMQSQAAQMMANEEVAIPAP
ncbi:MAG: hypothetical protein MUQ51_00170 [Pseudomonadota bacterium]|nr:hypothetical protein [Pseudomonadota bacterium]MDO7710028.1 hypothetical protein [Pseudomonadota bacterium]